MSGSLKKKNIKKRLLTLVDDRGVTQVVRLPDLTNLHVRTAFILAREPAAFGWYYCDGVWVHQAWVPVK